MKQNEVFDLFVTALESNRVELFDQVFSENAQVVSSAHGELKGLKAIKEGLAWKGEKLDYKKLRIFNNVLRSKDNYAYQFCYLIVELSKETNGFMNNFNCAFRLTAEYKKETDWKITEVRANMVYEIGNTLLVSNQWKMMDYSKWDGNDTVIIDPVKHDPWIIVPESTVEKTIEEEVSECFWHYTWCIDTDNYEELAEFVTDNIALTKFGQKTGKDFVNWMKGRREKWVEYDGVKMPKEACWNHLAELKEINIESEDYVTANVYRTEPNRLGNRFLHKYNLGAIFYTAIWHVAFKKIDGKWYIDKWGYEGISTEDLTQKERRYFK